LDAWIRLVRMYSERRFLRFLLSVDMFENSMESKLPVRPIACTAGKFQLSPLESEMGVG
jgi:hypothetical protein